jgi:hypothetical protein
MPHSSHKNVNAPMDAWDRNRLAIALFEIRDALALLCVDQGALERVHAAIHNFANEVDPSISEDSP